MPARDHGLSESPTYHAWENMHARCSDSPKYFKDYKQRGIQVCPRWKSFKNFLADMGEKPAGKTLDRKDNDGNYEPGNCRWATRKQQQNNGRHNYRITHNDVTMTLAQWSRKLKLSRARTCAVLGVPKYRRARR